MIAQQPPRYIELADGTRIIAGLGFPPRRTMRRQQVVQSIGFIAAFFAIASILLLGGSF